MRQIDWNAASPGDRERALARPVQARSREVADGVARIIAEVRERGAEAVDAWSERLDGAPPRRIEIDDAAVDEARGRVAPADIEALALAATNIRAFHSVDRPADGPWVETVSGARSRRVWRPIGTAGLYIPGGTAPLFSTLLMLAIPAEVAGVERRIAVTPPGRDGSVHPMMILAAREAGLDALYVVGGAQAVAALALGAGLPRADKIFGPGNAWVAEAKRQVAGRVGVDIHAGPSEVLVLDDGRADPARVARDLVAQSEHDVLAIAVCVTTSRALWEALPGAVDALLAAEPNPVAARALADRGAVILAPSLDAAVGFVNRFAPEHLELEADPAVVDRITAAGAIFVGAHTPEPVGDYWAGPNHTLPTGGCARFQSALGTADFVRRIHVVDVDAAWLRREGPAIARFAREEGLVGHARAVEVRLADADPPTPADGARYALPEVRAQRAYTLEAPPDAPAKLNQNEAPDDLPAEVKAAILDRAAALDWRRYPPFDDRELRARIAARDGWTADGVLVGNGSNELLATLFQAVVGFGETVVIPSPTFSLYPLHLAARGARLVRVPLDPADDFAYRPEAVLHAARGAKLVLLCSPNNPTGSVLPEGLVDRLLAETDALVAVDEAYREWCGQDLSRHLGERVVLLRTFSKALAMAGLRFGYLLGPPSLCTELHKLLLPYNVNGLTRVAVEALLDRDDLVAARVAHVTRERARLAAALRGVGRRVVEGGANFLLFSSDDPPGEFRRLLQAGVLVRDLSAAVPGHLRVSVGSVAEDDAFLAALGGARA